MFVFARLHGAQMMHELAEGGFLDCTDGTKDLVAGLHPRPQGGLDGSYVDFHGAAGSEADCFGRLRVTRVPAVALSFAVAAGPAGSQDPPSGIIIPAQLRANAPLATTASKHWYVLFAMGDRDDDDTSYSMFLSTSETGAIHSLDPLE